MQSGRCGACDYCLDELEPAAAPTVLARQILSCVVRVGQRFGAMHVASVLRGHASDQVVARGHDKLSTFGLLPHASVAEDRGYIQQLTALGLLRMTDDAYSVLALTARGLALLRDEASCPGLALARQRTPRKDTARPRSTVEAESWQDVDRALFERLRAVRLETARQRGVPPYVIFHDATLREMARLRPTSIDALLAVKGSGRPQGGRSRADLPLGDSRARVLSGDGIATGRSDPLPAAPGARHDRVAARSDRAARGSGRPVGLAAAHAGVAVRLRVLHGRALPGVVVSSRIGRSFSAASCCGGLERFRSPSRCSSGR